MVYVVGYDSNVKLVTSNEAEAQDSLAESIKLFPDLDWKIRSIEEAVKNAWTKGYEDGYDDGAYEGDI